MSARVAVIVFPGSNSEIETKRALEAVGLNAHLVRSDADARELSNADAYVLPGGFAYEDRIRAGAVAAHDRALDVVIEAAQAGKPVIGICNGAQILLEAGLVPGTGVVRRPTAAFAPNASGRYRCMHVYVRLTVAPARSPLLEALPPDVVLPAWAAHGEGRLAASFDELASLRARGHVAFTYCDRSGAMTASAIPNGSALGAAALINREGNVLAIMPHPERDAWTFMHRDGQTRARARGDSAAMLAPSGGIVFFQSLARSLR